MRLFIAIPFENGIKDGIVSAQEGLKRSGVTGNFTTRDNLHLTLAFIGETRDAKGALNALCSVDPPRMALRFSDPVLFRDILTAGLVRNEELEKYVTELRRALDGAEVGYDRKPFRAHVTLVRRAVLPPDIDLAACLAPLRHVEIPVREICLMKTDFINNRPRYTRIGAVRPKN